ncbi:amidase [Roseibium sp. M-1]
MDCDELANLTAIETAALVKSGQVSPVAVTACAIERIERDNPALNVVVFKGYDEALEQARRIERRLLDGDEVGPLAGVPTLMKDLFSFKPGWPSTLGGVRALKNSVWDIKSNFVDRVEHAGAVILGRTNSATLGFAGTTDNLMFGPTRNPYNLEFNSGGSSGGAAAVASGMVPFAEGSDGGGSVRIPAAWCGLVGFQPSFGCVPAIMRPNAFGATAPFIYEGPMGRTVEDIATVMSVLGGYSSKDPFSSMHTPDFSAALRQSVRGMRIGLTEDFGIFPVDRWIADTVNKAGFAFEEAGATVERMEIGIRYSALELGELWCRMISAVSFGALNDLASGGVDLLNHHKDDFPDELVKWVQIAERMSLAEMQADQIMRTHVFDCFCDAFSKYDLIVSPVTSFMPFKNATGGDTVGPSQVGDVHLEPRVGWAMTYLTNFTGHPAASVPAGMIDGLPVGIQIIGRKHGDADVIAACAEFEKVRPWGKAPTRAFAAA